MDINSADIVCLTCYKAHKMILEQENEQSKDKDLQELMVTLKTADLASIVARVYKREGEYRTAYIVRVTAVRMVHDLLMRFIVSLTTVCTCKSAFLDNHHK